MTEDSTNTDTDDSSTEPARETWRTRAATVMRNAAGRVKTSRSRTALRVLGFVVLIALVVPFVVHAVPGLVGAEHSYVVLSGSMKPAIAPGDSVIVNEQDPAAIERGDVITFATEGDDVPTTHRVVEIQQTENGRTFITKGDANENRDSQPVAAENVVGTMAVSIPYIGYVIRFAGTRAGFAVLVGGPIALLVLSEAIALGRSASESSDDSDAGNASDGTDDEASNSPGEATTHDTDGGDHDGTDRSTIAIAPTDLRLALVVLSVFAAYSVVVALLARTAWSVAVAVAVVGCLGLGVALAWSAREGDTTDGEPVDAVDAETINEGDVDATDHVADGGRRAAESDEQTDGSNEGESS